MIGCIGDDIATRNIIHYAFSNISNPLFIILCTSLLPFSLRCCITKRREKTAGKTRNIEDISYPPCHDVTLSFRTFPKEAGTKVGTDQLAPPVRVGSTRIDSDQLG